MQRNLIVTKDGSHSIAVPEWQVAYHSVYGAVQESLHVFIEAGLRYWRNQNKTASRCVIFEMGFGTGLNALLTALEAERLQVRIMYETVEAFPLEQSIIEQLNYSKTLEQPASQPVFALLHSSEWNTTEPITDLFSLRKVNTLLANYTPVEPVNIIYYDAFAPGAQPDLWTSEVFEQLLNMLAPDGILVTYCSKGDVRRAMIAAGFHVEKIPGPPGKREMLRAKKLNA
ncbi:tRNA (5-methylaminomethyl-2-thiouridine)(34)-methyltransferase MnmD [Longitalea luteola]|uniref:tRNA (5-methylaminomethyl-2-thiouridine)(34)-methyltransferase MnmD n=1 Tax=Longitalea luteola TaxID=2812563 RepID=UPI001A974B57|nr:tRNA (5-methylaminomethyl-2-thiouridine)(34)-methyltransferase MnmD [Longitalea luteola]